MIDVAEIGKEALETLADKEHCAEIRYVTKTFGSNEVIQNVTTNALMANPLMAIAIVAMSDKELAALQSLFVYYWEMGRLYGRQEIVRETMGE